MAKASPKKPFQKSARPSVEEGALVHYVWLNERKERPGELEYDTIGVVLNNLDRAYENARRYPKAKFSIWFDYERMNDMSQYFVKSHAYINMPGNVTLRDVRDIPTFKNYPNFFGSGKRESIASQCDLARLLVLQDCLKNTDAQTVIYADFDIKDIKLDSPKVVSCLQRWGAIVAGTKRFKIENGFLGFSKEQGKEIVDAMIKIGIREDEKGNCIFEGFYIVMDAFARRHGLDKNGRDLSIVVASDSGIKLKVPRFYRDLFYKG